MDFFLPLPLPAEKTLDVAAPTYPQPQSLLKPGFVLKFLISNFVVGYNDFSSNARKIFSRSCIGRPNPHQGKALRQEALFLKIMGYLWRKS